MPKFKVGDLIHGAGNVYIVDSVNTIHYTLRYKDIPNAAAFNVYIGDADAFYNKIEKHPMADINVGSLYNSQTDDSACMVTATDFQKNEVTYRFVSGNNYVKDRYINNKMELSEFLHYFIKREEAIPVTKKDCTCDSKALFDFGCRCGGFKASLNKE